MKLIIITAFVLLILSLGLIACSTATEKSVEVSCNDFGTQPHRNKQINVAAGNTFTVALCSNPSTGFHWSESAQISDQTIVQQTSHKFVPLETPDIVGASGKEVWTFKALHKGTNTIIMEYSQPWENGEKGNWTFNLTVVIK